MNFPATQWTQLAQATLHGGAVAADALASFCAAYRAPVMNYVLSRGLRREDAEDAVQSFMIYLMEHSLLKRADRLRGRFRSFLLTSLRNFLSDRQARQDADRRGGGAALKPLHLVEEELADERPGAEVEFDRNWALNIMQRALAAVEAQRPPEVFAAIRAFLPGSAAPPSYAEVSSETGMTEVSLRAEVSRVRASLRRLIRAEVARTVDSPAEVDEEMSWLFSVLTRQ